MSGKKNDPGHRLANDQRELYYRRQNNGGDLTPRQRRRIRLKRGGR